MMKMFLTFCAMVWLTVVLLLSALGDDAELFNLAGLLLLAATIYMCVVTRRFLQSE